MRLPQMRAGLTISTAVHAALLLWGLVSFSARPLEAAQTDSLPIDIVTDKEFSKLAAGVKNAPKAETPKPLVEKVGETKPSDEPVPKVSEKPEVKTASEPPPQAESKPEKAEAKEEKKEPPKVDPIAEALKKEEARKKREEAKAKAAELKKKKEEQQPKFDPKQIAALLDKRDAQRHAAVGETLSQAPSLGTSRGAAPQLSQGEFDAMRARLAKLWSLPAGVNNADELMVTVRIQLGRDRRLLSEPRVVSSGRGALSQVARDSAVRALLIGQPYDMLRTETYEAWKEMEIVFDPKFMFR